MVDIVIANRKFNEWCGTEGINYYEGDTALGFLFKYAVEGKLKELGYHITYSVDYDPWFAEKGRPLLHHWAILKGSHQLMGSGEDKDPALALFWAIYPVVTGKEAK